MLPSLAPAPANLAVRKHVKMQVDKYHLSGKVTAFHVYLRWPCGMETVFGHMLALWLGNGDEHCTLELNKTYLYLYLTAVFRI